MSYNQDKLDVAVYDKVRVYYKVNKKLGGLIKVFSESRIERLGRTITVVYPKLDKEDRIMINGILYEPNRKESNQ
jgi:hypothetical protein